MSLPPTLMLLHESVVHVQLASSYIVVTVLTHSASKQGAIVGGQTSCKAPEIAAFEQHLPSDVEIVCCHSLHGPNVDPRGQPLVGHPQTVLLYIH